MTEIQFGLSELEIATFIGALIICYLAGLKIGKVYKLIKELGNGA